jgi:hypothetical protein
MRVLTPGDVLGVAGGDAMAEAQFTLELTLQSGYAFTVDFGQDGAPQSRDAGDADSSRRGGGPRHRGGASDHSSRTMG